MLIRAFAAAAVLLCTSASHLVAEPAPSQTKSQEAEISPDDQAKSTLPAANAPEEDYPEINVRLVIPDEQKDPILAGILKPPSAAPTRAVSKPTPVRSSKEKAQANRRTQLARKALSFRGTRYVWGGDGRTGFDCSGFTQYLYAERGIKLPHSAKMQFALGTPVSRAELQPGDLVFFNTRGPLTHVGMYIGDGKFIHAANPRRGVVVSRLDSPFYSRCYAGARRYTK